MKLARKEYKAFTADLIRCLFDYKDQYVSSTGVSYGKPEFTTAGDVWAFFHLVMFEKKSDDKHPRFKGGYSVNGEWLQGKKRIVAHDANWNIYPRGINDTHYKTLFDKMAGKTKKECLKLINAIDT